MISKLKEKLPWSTTFSIMVRCSQYKSGETTLLLSFLAHFHSVFIDLLSCYKSQLIQDLGSCDWLISNVEFRLASKEVHSVLSLIFFPLTTSSNLSKCKKAIYKKNVWSPEMKVKAKQKDFIFNHTRCYLLIPLPIFLHMI